MSGGFFCISFSFSIYFLSLFFVIYLFINLTFCEKDKQVNFSCESVSFAFLLIFVLDFVFCLFSFFFLFFSYFQGQIMKTVFTFFPTYFPGLRKQNSLHCSVSILPQPLTQGLVECSPLFSFSALSCSCYHLSVISLLSRFFFLHFID